MTDRSAPMREAMGFPEMVAFTAAVMALGALSIDIMLPAFDAIARDLSPSHANDVQKIVYAFMIGYGVAQLFFGPISDRYGRRAVLLAALGLYCLAAALSVFSSSFAILLIARAAQGACTAAARVAIMASIRDRYSGVAMAEVMSAATTVFMAAPILAPAIGQSILFIAEWPMIFTFLFLYGVTLGGWSFMRMTETLAATARRSLRLGAIFAAFGAFSQNRLSLGYTLVTTALTGAFFAYLGSAQQIYVGVFDLGPWFPLAFSIGAIPYGAAALTNAKVVKRFGMRPIVHIGIVAVILINGAHLLLIAAGGESLAAFLGAMCATLFALGFVSPNSLALAMEPMGAIAGAAAAANGFITTTGAALIGQAIGARLSGGTSPISEGFFWMSLAALALCFWAERGRLFAPPAEAAS